MFSMEDLGILVGYLAACALVAKLAARWGRDPWKYFFGSLLLTPGYGILRLLLHGKAPDDFHKA
jgi:hypothetical protein